MGVEGTRSGKAVHKLRARWLEPSPPLAVDDEEGWSPSPDPSDEEAGAIETDSPAAPRAAS